MVQKPTYEELEQKIKTLQENEKRYRSILQTATDGFILTDSNDEGRLLDVNDAYCTMSGYTKEELLSMRIRELVVSESPEEVSLRAQTVLEKGGDWFEAQHRRKDGTTLDLEVSIKTYSEDRRYFFSFLRDITERKQSEEEREKLQTQLSNALEIANLVPWEYDVVNDLHTFNDPFYKVYRTTAEEVGGYTMSSGEYAWRFVHPDDMYLIGETVKRAMEGKSPAFGDNVEHRIIYGDGSVGHVSVKMILVKDSQGKVIHIYGVNQDITERKQDELEKEKLQTLLSNALEIANLAPWEYDINEDLFTFNDYYYRLHRTTVEEVGGYTMSSSEHARRFVIPNDIQIPMNEIIEAIDPDSGHRIEHRALYGDGTVGYTSVKMFVVKDSQGRPIRTYGVSQDITEHKQTELEQEKLQAQLSNALEIANLAPWEYDIANDRFILNDHFYKVFRTTAEEMGGYEISSEEHARHFVHPDDNIGPLKELIETIDFNPEFLTDHRTIYPDGTVGYTSVKMFVVRDNQGKAIRAYGVNQDITEQKRVEEELLKTQKLESVGILAGGIAHDFNNILTTILGNTYMAKMEVDPEDEIFELLNEMETASSRAQALTKQLLTFAKGGAPVKETSTIKEAISKSSIFVLRGSKSRCEFSIEEDLWPVDVDVAQISQVINNVVMNANQAMPDGGIVRVAGKNITIEDKHGLSINPGRYVRVSITDQGMGITEENISKVFDPFFTTKAEGSGLGLATAYSIVKKHDGHIRVESVLGEGTTFQIYLPSSDAKVQKKEDGSVIPGMGKILMMDDEAALRKIAGKMLVSLGYKPEFAEEGTEAIEMYRVAKGSGKPYDAVILDLTVPGGMGGKDTIKKLLEIDPKAKVIVSSGYSDDLVLANFEQYGFKGILPKPFDPQSLSKVLSEVTLRKAKP